MLDDVFVQQMPVIIAGNKEQQKKYLGRMLEEPLMCVSHHLSRQFKPELASPYCEEKEVM